jgi:hypothetical protein
MQKVFPSPIRALSAIAQQHLCYIIRFFSLFLGQSLSSSVQRSVARSLVLLIAVAVVARSVDAQSPPIRLRIGLVVPANATQSTLSVARGVRLGAAESKQTTALFGGDVELFEAPGTGAAGVNAAANLLLSRRKVQILIAAAAEDVETLSQFAELHKLLSMNAASRHASLRSACHRNTFHVETPDIAYLNAKALARLAGTTASTNRMTGVAGFGCALERFPRTLRSEPAQCTLPWNVRRGHGRRRLGGLVCH